MAAEDETTVELVKDEVEQEESHEVQYGNGASMERVRHPRKDNVVEVVGEAEKRGEHERTHELLDPLRATRLALLTPPVDPHVLAVPVAARRQDNHHPTKRHHVHQ